MYTILDSTIEQPTVLNQRISQFHKKIETLMVDYTDYGFSHSLFGIDENKIYYNRMNDFTYLLTFCLLVYNEIIITENNGETIDFEEIYETYKINDKIEYFMIVHSFDINPLLRIFRISLTDLIYDDDVILGPEETYANIDPLVQTI